MISRRRQVTTERIATGVAATGWATGSNRDPPLIMEPLCFSPFLVRQVSFSCGRGPQREWRQWCPWQARLSGTAAAAATYVRLCLKHPSPCVLSGRRGRFHVIEDEREDGEGSGSGKLGSQQQQQLQQRQTSASSTASGPVSQSSGAGGAGGLPGGGLSGGMSGGLPSAVSIASGPLIAGVASMSTGTGALAGASGAAAGSSATAAAAGGGTAAGAGGAVAAGTPVLAVARVSPSGVVAQAGGGVAGAPAAATAAGGTPRTPHALSPTGSSGELGTLLGDPKGLLLLSHLSTDVIPL